MELRDGTAQEAGLDSRRLDLIRERGREWVESGVHQCLVLLVARRGRVVVHEAYGRIHPEDGSPAAQLDTIFPISSMSKSVAATCLMMLVEDGLVGLNRPVQEYIPEFDGEGKEAVMVHHLLTHTSGWEEDDVAACREKKRGKVDIPQCPEGQHPAIHEHLCLEYDAPLTRPPGQEMSYCSEGYNIVGEIVRRADGRPVHEFAHTRIFEPLSMQDTTFAMTPDKEHRIVRRRPLDPPPFGLDDPEYHRQPWAESGGLSTALDMAKFGQMLLNGGSYGERRLLSPAAVGEMTRNQIPGIPALYFDERFAEGLWGYGFDVLAAEKRAREYPTLNSDETFGHGGSGGVFLFVDPLYDTVCAYFSVAKVRSPDMPVPVTHVDLFVNMVAAAVT